MKLTLRTVLAYLDDVLEPAQAKEIGERISEVKEAEQLVNRIREVIRRRRIGAPEIAGPGSGPDPNLVADYLENILPPTQVVELEQLCRKSDIHLAEVAACHKILTLVIGQPITVPEEFRERMYALGSTRMAMSEPSETALPPMTTGMGNTPTGSSFEDGLPEYLKRGRGGRKFWIGAGIVLLAMLWLGLVVSDQSIWSTFSPEEDRLALQDVPTPVEPVEDARPAPPADEEKEQEVPDEKPPVEPAEIAAIPRTEETVRPDPEMIREPESPPSPPKPEVDVDDLEPADEPAPEAELVYREGTGATVVRLPEGETWSLLGEEAAVEPATGIASPAPFRSQFDLQPGLTLDLEPETRLKRLRRTEADDLSLMVVRGRIILTRPPTAEDASTVRLVIDGQQWLLQLLEPGTRVGVEVVPPAPQGPPERLGDLRTGGGIAVPEGSVQLQRVNDDDAVLLQSDNGWASWPQEGQPLAPSPGASVPPWLFPDGIVITPAARTLARTYEREFLEDRSVLLSVRPLIRDRRAALSELAVKTLSLIGHYKDVVPALNAEHEESRLAAIEGLREWMARDPTLEGTLRDEVARFFREPQVDPVMRLLWGYSAEDLQQPAVTRELLSWMKDDEIALRELAFYHVYRLTGRRFNYRPNLPLPERRAALSTLEESLRRTSGALIQPQ